MTAGIYTLGCRVNQYESAAIAQRLSQYGVVVCDAEEACDAYIINTCTVTAESARKAGQFIRRAIRENPRAFILVTGCYAQTESEKIAQISGVDYICGTRNKLSVADALLALSARGTKNDQPDIVLSDNAADPFEKMTISQFGRTRAYLKIEDGCENRCAYCIIPQARGRVCSKPEEDILTEVRTLADAGYPEIVLTGIETAAYGADLAGTDLISLIRKIDEIDGIQRIRLGSLDPAFADGRLAQTAAECSHLCNHFHLSLQSGCDRTLRRMRRKYNTAQAAENISRLRRILPDVCFSADIIVGFPGETEEDFRQTCDFIQKTGLLHGHIFSYSRRRGTEAERMPDQIPEEVKKERSRILNEICIQSAKDIITSHIGKVMEILVERADGHAVYGHTENFIEIEAPCKKDLRGKFQRAEITGCKNGKALAKILDL